jgi:hypothetical protein
VGVAAGVPAWVLLLALLQVLPAPLLLLLLLLSQQVLTWQMWQLMLQVSEEVPGCS